MRAVVEYAAAILFAALVAFGFVAAYNRWGPRTTDPPTECHCTCGVVEERGEPEEKPSWPGVL